MPVLKHAKKKLKQDKVRTEKNLVLKEEYKKLVKAAKKTPNAQAVSAAFSAIDKAAKKHIIHANKAARLKSGLTKSPAAKDAANESPKKTTAKKPAKSVKAQSAKKPVKK